MVEEDATIVERRVDCVLTREDCRRASSSSDMGIFCMCCVRDATVADLQRREARER